MHDTESTENDGVTTTELTLAFQIRTPYICCDVSEIHIIVALGTDVYVNFILINYWMKQIGAILDYGANQLRVPLQDDYHNLRITYRTPHKYVPSPDLCSSHEIDFMALPKIEGLLSVMSVFNPNIPWLVSARNMVRILQSVAA